MGRRKIESQPSQEVKAKRIRKQKNVDHADANNNDENNENNNNNVLAKTENNNKSISDKKSKSFEENNNNDESMVKNNNNEVMEEDKSNSIIMKLENHSSLLVQNMPKWHEISNYFNDEDKMFADHDSHTDSSEDDSIKEDPFNLKKSNFTDLTITTNDQRNFAVHTLLFVAASQKFREELIKIRKETNNFYIELENVSGQEFVWILDYVYNGQVVLRDEQQKKRFEFLLRDFGFITASDAEVKVKEDAKDDSFAEEKTIIRIGKGGKCVECEKQFTTYFAAKKHFELKHTTPVDPSKFTCSICGKTNSHQFYLDRHLRERHGIMKRAKKSLVKENSKEN